MIDYKPSKAERFQPLIPQSELDENDRWMRTLGVVIIMAVLSGILCGAFAYNWMTSHNAARLEQVDG